MRQFRILVACTALLGCDEGRAMQELAQDMTSVDETSTVIEDAGPSNGSAMLDMGYTTMDGRPPDATWVEFQGGSFLMGGEGLVANGDTFEFSESAPIHDVQVPPFALAKAEVTVAEYRRCVQAGACRQPPRGLGEWCNWPNWQAGNVDDHPINCLTWRDACEYARWAGARLPSEAEWEYAARSGGQAVLFPWGNEPVTCDRANIESATLLNPDAVPYQCPHLGTQPVCSRPLGNSAQGICDLAGNVDEFVADEWHADYQGAPLDGSSWAENLACDRGGDVLISRGGGWLLPAFPSILVFYRRFREGQNNYDAETGLRLVRRDALNKR